MRTIITLLLIGVVLIQGYAQSSKAQQMEAFADSIEFVSLSDYINGGGRRTNYVIDNVRVVAGSKPANSFKPLPPPLMERFTTFAKTLTMPEIEVFLKDKNPKVRGLALLSIYQLEDQKALLRYADFLGDSAVFLKSRPYHVPDIGILDGPVGDAINLSQKDLLVADIARRILSEYMDKAGCDHFDDDLPQFLKERQNLDYTLGFLMLKSHKSLGFGRGFNNLGLDSTMMVLKARISDLPNKLDACIYKVFMPMYDERLFIEAERLEALRFLGKQHAKEILEGMPPTKDPDLHQIRHSEHHGEEYYRICEWILMNAPVVFDSSDIGYLLDRADFELKGGDVSLATLFNYRLDFTYLYYACARLDTINASKYLKDCIQYAGTKAENYAELWHRCGQSEIEFILDWFFGTYKLNEYNYKNSSNFINALEAAKDTMLIKRIIADSRFEDSIRVCDVILLASRYNNLSNKTTIPDEMFQAITHPYGITALEFKMVYALKEYPMQTKEALEKRPF